MFLYLVGRFLIGQPFGLTSLFNDGLIVFIKK